MRWKLRGQLVWHPVLQYRVKWDKKAPSKIAQEVKDFIHQQWRYDIWLEEMRLPKSLLRVDFLNVTKKFAIEVNGRQHSEYSEFHHKNKMGYAAACTRDIVKVEFLEANGYQVIEIYNEDLPLTKAFFHEFGISV